MAVRTKAWILRARLRRLVGRPGPDARERRREEWIKRHARGRSFADIGGLFAVHGERALLAEAAGAEPVTLFDAGDVRYSEFPRKSEKRGSEIRVVQGDLEDPVAIREIGEHDIVWCTGVIYHTPNPVRQLMHLREITRELLYLGTHTIPELPGVRNGCVYYPMLDEASRAAYASAHYKPDDCLAIGTPFDDRPMTGHGNFWWGLSLSALEAMLATARFEVVERWRDREHPFYADLVARPVNRDPVLPPISYYRERAEAIARGEPEPPFRGYYEWKRTSAGPSGTPPTATPTATRPTTCTPDTGTASKRRPRSRRTRQTRGS